MSNGPQDQGNDGSTNNGSIGQAFGAQDLSHIAGSQQGGSPQLPNLDAEPKLIMESYGNDIWKKGGNLG